MLKRILKKFLVILLLTIVLTTSTNIVPTAYAVATTISETIVNLGVEVKLVNSTDEVLKTGEVHNVTVKSSYSNPNDEEKAKVRLYLWEYNEEFLTNKESYPKVPSSAVEVMNLVDGKIVYALENSSETSVTVQLVETETERYLEYELPAGSSADIELGFKVKNGLYNNIGIILEPVIVNPTENNNKADEPISLLWKGEFGWQNLYNAANPESLGIKTDKTFNNDIKYTYSASSLNLTDKNEIWTSYVEFENTITVPACMDITSLLNKKDINGNFTNSLYDANGNVIYSFSVAEYDYSISSISVSGNKIIVNGKVENPFKENGVLTSEFNPVNNMSTIFNTSKLSVNDTYVSEGADIIKNEIKCVFYPCTENVEAITLNTSKDVWIMPDSQVLSISKTSDKTEVKYDDRINYEITLNNNTRFEKTQDVWDILPEGIHIANADVKKLKEEGYKVGEAKKLYDQAEIVSAQVSYDSSNYWDNTNPLTNSYYIGKKLDLHSGVKVMFDLHVPSTYEHKSGKFMAVASFSMGDNWEWEQNMIEVDFSTAKIEGNYKVIPICIQMPDSCIKDTILQSVTVSLIGSGAGYSGEMRLSNFRLYDGIVEIPEVLDDLDSPENIVYTRYTGANEYYSDSVDYSYSSYWDDDEFYITSYMNGLENTLSSDVRVAFDLYMPFTQYSVSDKLYAFVAVQGNSDWSGWIQTQACLLVSDFTNTYTSNGYMAHVELMMPEGIEDFDSLQSVYINIVGSCATAEGTARIKNIKLYSLGVDSYPNAFQKTVTLPKDSSQKINYTTIVNTKGTLLASNIATLGTGEKYHSDKTTVQIQSEYVTSVEDGEVKINKEIAARIDNNCDKLWTKENDPYVVSSGQYESELNVLGEGDLIYYTVTLSNGTASDKTYTISDYSPLYGTYHAISGTPYWYKYTQISGLQNCYGMYGYDTQLFDGENYETISEGPVTTYTDFIKNMTTKIDKTTEGKFTFTLKIPANTELKQTFILQVPEGETYKKYEEVVRSYLAKSSGDYDIRNEQVSGNSYNNTWVPHTTIIIDGSTTSKFLRHTLERKYNVTNYALGQDKFYEYKDYSYDRNTINNDLGANYWLDNPYYLTNSGNQYMLYGTTIFNDSTEPLFMDNTRLFIDLPQGTEFYGFAIPDIGYQSETLGIRFAPTGTGSSADGESSYFITLKDKYGNQYNTIAREKGGWGAGGYRYQDEDTVEINFTGTSSAWFAYGSGVHVQPNYSEEYYYNLNTRSAYIQPYQSMSFYYVLKVKDDNIYTGIIETKAILDITNVYDIHKVETNAEYVNEVDKKTDIYIGTLDFTTSKIDSSYYTELWNLRDDGTWESGKYSGKITSNEFIVDRSYDLVFDWTICAWPWQYVTYRIINVDSNLVYKTETLDAMDNSSYTYNLPYEKLEFEHVEVNLPKGKYILEFEYNSSGGHESWLDAAFVRNVKLYESVLMQPNTNIEEFLSKYTTYYEKINVLTSTVTQKIKYDSEANIYNSVIGRNSYTDIQNGTATANVYNKDMNKCLLDAEEVVTFAVVVANGEEEDSINKYNVNVELPEGLEFIGCHTISENSISNKTVSGYYVNYTYDNGFNTLNVVTDYTINSTTSAGPHEYALSSLITDDSQSINGSLSSTHKNGYSFFTCNPYIRTKTNMVNTGSDDYTNNYKFIQDGSNLNFEITQSGNTATYIIYSCKVNLKSEEEIVLTNTAKLTSENNNIKYFEQLDFAPYYNSSYTGRLRFNVDGQNITKGNSVNQQQINATVTLTGIPKGQSIDMEKTLVAAYDKDNLVYYGAYYEGYNNGDATDNYLGYKQDTKVLGTYKGANGGNVNGVPIDGTIQMYHYAPIDGIHNTNWYRNSVVWNVRVTNNGIGNVDVSKIVEQIDAPFKLYGYSLMLYDDRGALIGAFTVNNNRIIMEPDSTIVEYNSKVTNKPVIRNVYNIDLVEDVEKVMATNPGSPTLITTPFTDADLSNWDGKTFKDYLIGLPENYSYDLFLYSDMQDENLDWYYSTTTVQLKDLDTFTFLTEENPVEKDITLANSATMHLEGLQETSFVSVLASDGIKTVEKYNLEDDYTVNTKNTAVYASEENNQIVNYTLEMGSYLYQSKYYKNGSLDNIVFYDLLPGLQYGGLDPNEVGGGYTVNTDSYSAYILRTDGTKELIDSSHYKVMYSMESLHSGMHPIAVMDDTAYNVDFNKAADESIWINEYNKDCRSFRVVFDDTIILKNADRLYFDYNVTMRDDTLLNQEYHNVFGYIYDCNDPLDSNNVLRLYEDTTDLRSVDESPKVTVSKYVIDCYNEKIEELEDEDNVEYTFGLYTYTGNLTSIYQLTKIAEFKLKANESIKLSKVFDSIGMDDNALSGNFAIMEEDNEFADIYSIKSETENNVTFGRVDLGNVFTFTASNYNAFLDSIANVKFTNKVKNSERIQLRKIDQDGKPIIFKDTSVTYQIHDSEGNNLKFELKDGNYYYNENGTIENIESTSNIVNLYYLPYGDYTIKEVTPPANYIGLAEEQAFTVESRNDMIIDIVNTKISQNNLSIEKVDSETGEIIDETCGNATFRVSYLNSYNYWNTAYLVDLGIDEEKGHMYTLNTNGSTEEVYIVETYKGKIYIENVSSNLKFEEYNVPFGYSEIDTNGYIFEYSSTVDEATMKIENAANYRNRVLIKKDYTTGEILDNVSYSLYRYTNSDPSKFIKTGTVEYKYENTIYTIPSYKMVSASYKGEDAVTVIETNVGMVNIEHIPKSEYMYYIKEVKAPEGYVLPSSWAYIYSSDTDDYKIITNKQNKGYVELTKKDDKNKVITDPVTFEVYDSNDNKMKFDLYDFNDQKGNTYNYSEEGTVSEITTHNGKIRINRLPIGTYRLIETKSIENYGLEKGYYEFTVTENHTVTWPLKLTVTNVPLVGDAIFTKVDSKGTTITDTAKFNIIDIDGNPVKFQNDEGTYKQSAEGSEIVSTIDGKINIDNLATGTYTLKEIEAPEGYLIGNDTTFTITKSHYHSPLKMNIVNKHAYGDIQIDKYNANGEIITTSSAVFIVYDENDNQVSFNYNNETGENGRIYNYAKGNENTTRLSTDNGKILIKGLPIGKYYLKEVVAPNGYSVHEGNINFEVTESSAFAPTKVRVTNPDYIFGTEEYVSSSYQKIEEKDNNNNLGYGYFGKESDYEAGNMNYIYVDAEEDIVRYSLVVGNMSKKNFEKLVLINKLPGIDDTGVINLDKERGSEFTVKLAENPNYNVYVLDNNGEKVQTPEFTIEYTDEISFTESDFDGQTSDKWYAEVKDSTKAFRIKFNDGFVLPASYKIVFEFDGEIQEDAEPGLIAWNSFGYRYYVGDIKLSPEPPKVGVKIPNHVELTKLVEGDVDGNFEFEIYEKLEDKTLSLIKTITAKTNETVELKIKRIVNGENVGELEDGKTYVIKEKDSKQFKQIKVESETGTIYNLDNGKVFEFTYDIEEAQSVEFTNAERNIGEVELTKKDSITNKTLKDAEFELRDKEGNVLNVVETENGYKYVNTNTENSVTKLYTDKNGVIKVTGLPYGEYNLYETKAPKGYIYGSKNDYKFTINDDVIEMDENGICTAKVVKLTATNEPTKVKVEKYFDTTINNHNYKGNVEGALLQVWNEDKTVMYKEFTTTEKDSFEITNLPVGKFVLVEKMAPNKFAKAEDISFEITTTGKVLVNGNEVKDKTIRMEDEFVTGSIIINKKGKVLEEVGLIEKIKGFFVRVFNWITGNLKDVTFEIYSSEEVLIGNNLVYEKDQLIGTITTDESGIARLDNLLLGDYYAVEVKTDENHEIIKTPISLSLKYKDQDTKTVVCAKTVENELIQGTVNVINRDEKDPNTVIEGTIIGVYSKEETEVFKKDELISVIVTDEEGRATFDLDIPVGNYYIKEIEVKHDYIISDKVVEFTFEKSGIFEFEFVNAKVESVIDPEIQDEENVKTGDNIWYITMTLIIAIELLYLSVLVKKLNERRNKVK